MSSAATSSVSTSSVNTDDVTAFSEHLQSSKRILALCGAGLSASSGLPTFRGAGGYWRTYDATSLATPEAFHDDPSLVWQFYSYRRHMAFKAQPNAAHFALAELARRKQNFLTITQNVDGLSQRAGHPKSQIEFLHGSLTEVQCTNFDCDYVEHRNFTDPIVPGLALPLDQTSAELDISSAEIPLKEVAIDDLPQCPKCKTSLLRPGVVWFGEPLPQETMKRVDDWMSKGSNIDLIMVIGTSAAVYPAAGYIEEARDRGARVAVINMERPEKAVNGLQEGDWFFQGDAARIIPQILEPVVGPVQNFAGHP